MSKYHIIICILSFCITSITSFSLRVTRQISYNEGCTCVPHFLCDRNDITGTGGDGVYNHARIHAEPLTMCTGNNVCCKKPKLSTDVSPTSGMINAEPRTVNQQCGRRDSSNFYDRGNLQTTAEAGFGEFPWMVALYMYAGGINLFICGASIIQENVLLTAAHCVYQIRVSDLKIHAGEWDLLSEIERPRHQERFVSRIIIHPEFHNQTMKNDIALLVLANPLRFTSNVVPVCLPTNEIVPIVNSTQCVVNGWGKDKFGQEGLYKNILKKTELPVVPHNECQTRLRTTRLGRFFKLHESFICAGGELNIDACQGDGGGPLVCNLIGSNPPTYVQMGITSWGIGCRGTVPGVYTSVFAELPWITTELANINSNPI